jgi:hypothetical protein
MLKKLFILFSIFTFFSATISTSFAQNENAAAQKKETPKIHHAMNFIKTNITGIILKNYSLQYERVLSRKFSFALQYRMMPTTTIPFQKLILKQVGDDDPDTKKTIEDLKLSNNAITPELRWYVGKKGYGRGFYIAPFFRYANFKTNNIDIFYTDSSGSENSISLSGKLSSYTGGILFGVQHHYGKHIVLDVWLLGPHYGSGKGEFDGVSSKPLSQSEQNDLRDNLNNIDIPLTTKTVNVNPNGASLKLDGPWGGLRSGISLGYKF